MTNLTAKFCILDDMSDSIARISQAGMSMVEQFERASDISSTAFDGISTRSTKTASAVDSVATSINNLQEITNSAVSSADTLTNTIDEYGDAANEVRARIDEFSVSTDILADSMDNYGDAAGNATDELRNFERVAENVSDEMENNRKTGVDTVETLSNALTAAGITQLVKEVAEAFLVASEAAAEFEVATMKISTVADTAKVSLSQLSAEILDLSRETGISVNSLSEAAYSALSASVDTTSAIEFTATATKLAAGGFTSSATAVDVLTTALNAYGLEVTNAESISDMLITTQNLGKTTVDELAASVGKIIPLASAYGVEMDNLSAAYAELTKGGIATAEAGTYLKSMLTELGDSASTVSEVLIEQTGSSFAELIEQGYSLGDVLAVLGQSVGGNAGAFNELWSSSEAGIGALALYNSGAEQFNTTLNTMRNSVGATETAYSTMTDTTAHAQEELSNAARNLQIAIGQNINPALEMMYELGTRALNSMSEFAQKHPIVVKALSAVAIGIGAVATGIIGYTFVTKVAIPAITTFGIALNRALGPIGWVALAITTVVAVGTALVAMLSDANTETVGMTATTRAQYYELQDINTEYEKTCERYGETSEEALRLKYQVDDLSAAFEVNKQTIEEFTAEVDALCESVSQITSDFNDSITAIKNTEIGSFALIQKYEDLATQVNRTQVEEEALTAITKKLAESYPDLAAEVDGATLSTEEYVEAMKKACEQQAEEQRYQQAHETYTEALQKQAELEAEIAKAEANLNAEREARGMYYDEQMQQWTNGSYTEDSLWASWTTDLDKYNDALEKLNAAQAENETTLAQIEQGWADIAAAEEAAAEETISWEDAATAAYENVKDRIVELCETYGEVYNAAFESFEGQFGLFDEASMKSEEYVNSTVENAQKALDSQLAYWNNYLANIDVLKSTSAEQLGITQENYEALMVYAQDGSEQAAGLAQSMVDNLNSGNEEAVAALANTVGEVNTKQQEIAATTADWVTNFISQMDEIEQEMQSTIEGMNLDTEAKASATATIQSYADAIRAGKANAISAAEEVANAVSAVFASAKTTISVNVSSSGSIPGHANGTTNAESVFLAGEKGSELVARSVAAYAGGTTDSTDFFIAGENGPELIVGEQGSTVFPTEETERLISVLNTKNRPLQVLVNTGEERSTNRERTSEQVKRILLEIAGSGAVEVGGNGGADKETILKVLYEHLKPILMNIIQSEIYEEGELSYEY